MLIPSILLYYYYYYYYYYYWKYLILAVLNCKGWGNPSCTKVTTTWETLSNPKFLSLGVIASRHSLSGSGRSTPKIRPELLSLPKNWGQEMVVFSTAVGKKRKALMINLVLLMLRPPITKTSSPFELLLMLLAGLLTRNVMVEFAKVVMLLVCKGGVLWISLLISDFEAG